MSLSLSKLISDLKKLPENNRKRQNFLDHAGQLHEWRKTMIREADEAEKDAKWATGKEKLYFLRKATKCHLLIRVEVDSFFRAVETGIMPTIVRNGPYH